MAFTDPPIGCHHSEFSGVCQRQPCPNEGPRATHSACRCRQRRTRCHDIVDQHDVRPAQLRAAARTQLDGMGHILPARIRVKTGLIRGRGANTQARQNLHA